MATGSLVALIYFSVSGLLLIGGVARLGYKWDELVEDPDADDQVGPTIGVAFMWPIVVAAVIVVGPFWLVWKLGKYMRKLKKYKGMDGRTQAQHQG